VLDKSFVYGVVLVRLAEALRQERKQDRDDDDGFETFLEDGSDYVQPKTEAHHD
jgi:hypothetical protein